MQKLASTAVIFLAALSWTVVAQSAGETPKPVEQAPGASAPVPAPLGPVPGLGAPPALPGARAPQPGGQNDAALANFLLMLQAAQQARGQGPLQQGSQQPPQQSPGPQQPPQQTPGPQQPPQQPPGGDLLQLLRQQAQAGTQLGATLVNRLARRGQEAMDLGASLFTQLLQGGNGLMSQGAQGASGLFGGGFGQLMGPQGVGRLSALGAQVAGQLGNFRNAFGQVVPPPGPMQQQQPLNPILG